MSKYKFAGLFFLGFLLVFDQAKAGEPEKMYHLFGNTMGNRYAISWSAKNTSAARVYALHQKVEERLETINASMSTWQPQSEISRVNRAPQGQVMPLSPQLRLVVAEALRLGKLTSGALDITVGPLVNLWGFGPDGRPGRVPDTAEINRARAYTGIDKLTLSPQGLTKANDRTQLDLSAIAKGYGVDALGELLESQGINNYLVEIGGELVARGHRPDGGPWLIGVDTPKPGSFGEVARIAIGDRAVATSGDYRHYFEQQGTRFSHVIDPASGRAVQTQVVSATVIAPHCATADGLATAAMVMGAKATMALADRERLAVMLIEDHFGELRVHRSRQFQQFLRPEAGAPRP